VVQIHSPLKKNRKKKKNELKKKRKIFIMSTENKYFPEFGGSTGGWLQAAETEEKYVMTWTNSSTKITPEENIFEMPTGGAAIMKQGPNLVYFARKEQCLALGKQLRTDFKINDYRIFRLFPSGEIQFIHPKDGVFPEKVNEGRIAVGKREFSIGKNPNPASIKFTGATSFEA
jgi:photosystem I subunit II